MLLLLFYFVFCNYTRKCSSDSMYTVVDVTLTQCTIKCYFSSHLLYNLHISKAK